jgi:hypothetical protein
MSEQIYHVGNLAADRLRDDTVNVKANEAMELWRAGRAHLLQRIVSVRRDAGGNRTFEYLIVERRRR